MPPSEKENRPARLRQPLSPTGEQVPARLRQPVLPTGEQVRVARMGSPKFLVNHGWRQRNRWEEEERKF